MRETIGVILEKTRYQPGERIAGQAGWQFGAQPKHGFIRLFWRAHGSRPDDLEIVDEKAIDFPQAAQVVPFEFKLPESPYSYKGHLFSISWGVELVLDGHSDVAEFEMRG